MANKKSTEKLEKKEIENLIAKLAKEGMSATKIGQTLKTTYNISSVKAYGIKIKKILGEKGVKMEIPEDLQNLINRAGILKKHFNANKQDKNALRGLQVTEAKIRKLAKYYKKKRILSANWSY